MQPPCSLLVYQGMHACFVPFRLSSPKSVNPPTVGVKLHERENIGCSFFASGRRVSCAVLVRGLTPAGDVSIQRNPFSFQYFHPRYWEHIA